jgi:hypothetical protein
MITAALIIGAVLFAAPIHVIYHPHVIENGVCIVEPGSFAALYCSGVETPKPKVRKR